MAGQPALDNAQDQFGGRDSHVDTELVKQLNVARVVHPRNRPGHLELTLGKLAGDQVVLIVTGDRGHNIRTLDPGGGEKGHLVPIANEGGAAAQLGRHKGGAYRVLLDESDLVATLKQMPAQVEADLSGAYHDDVGGSLRHLRKPPMLRRSGAGRLLPDRCQRRCGRERHPQPLGRRYTAPSPGRPSPGSGRRSES